MGKRTTAQGEEYVTVRLTKEVHEKLRRAGRKDETFSDIIRRLIEAADKQ